MQEEKSNKENEGSIGKAVATLGAGLIVMSVFGGFSFALPVVTIIGGLGAISYLNNHPEDTLNSILNSSISTKLSLGAISYITYKFESLKAGLIAGAVTYMASQTIVNQFEKASSNFFGKNSEIDYDKAD